MYKIFLSHITNCHPVAMAFAIIIIIIIIIRVSLHVIFFVLIHKAVKYSFVRSLCKEGVRYAVLTSYLFRRRSHIYSQSSSFHQQIAKIMVRFTRKETGEKKKRQTFTHAHAACVYVNVLGVYSASNKNEYQG